MPQVRQEYKMHSLPSVFPMEAVLSDRLVNDLNEYLDDLLNQKDRASHAGTLVGQIGNGEQLTVDHTHPKIQEFNELIQIMGADYVKNFAGSTVNPFNENRIVETDECWSVHSYAGDYNPIHDHGTKTVMGISRTTWTKVPPRLSKGQDRDRKSMVCTMPLVRVMAVCASTTDSRAHGIESGSSLRRMS